MVVEVVDTMSSFLVRHCPSPLALDRNCLGLLLPNHSSTGLGPFRWRGSGLLWRDGGIGLHPVLPLIVLFSSYNI